MALTASPGGLSLSTISAIKHRIAVAGSERTSEHFQDSFGNQLSEIGGRFRWVLTGSALKIWLEDVCQKVTEALQWNEQRIYRGWSVREPIIEHCWMIGFDKSCAHPTVVISCQNSGILKKSMQAILKLKFLHERGFKLKGLPQCDLRLLATGDRHQVNVTSVGRDDEFGIPRSLCGAEVIVSGSNRLATIGGVITVNGTYYGLTVAHVFTGDAEQQEIAETDLQLYDSDFAYDSADDSNGGETDGTYDESNDIVDWSQKAKMPGNETGSATKSNITNTNLQDNSETTRLDVMKISSQNPLRGFEANIYDGCDWALIELDDDTFHCTNEVMLARATERYPRHLFLKNISVSAPSGEVLGITRRGTVKGFATGSSCSIKLSNSSIHQDVWSVQLEDTHALGDSGSWVIDPLSGDVYGVIIAGSYYLKEVYVIPIAKIFKDIGRNLRAASVALPTMQSTLHLASRYGNDSLVQRLLENHAKFPRSYRGQTGVDVNATAKYGERTALQAAAGRGHHEALKILVDAGADVNADTRYGERTALQAAAESGHHEVVKILVDAAADVNANTRYEERTALQAAAESGHHEVVKILVDAGADVNAVAGFGRRTALQAAVEGGHYEMVKILLDTGADVNATAEYGGRTALLAASKGGHHEVVKILVDAGADVNAVAGYGRRTALQAAIERDHYEMVKILLDTGADVNATAEYGGRTALLAASKGGHHEIVKILVDAGADVNTAVVAAAARGGHHEVAKMLLSAGADVNATAGYGGRAALQAATGGGHHEEKMFTDTRLSKKK